MNNQSGENLIKKIIAESGANPCDPKNSHITTYCEDYKKDGCPKTCYYAGLRKEIEKLEKISLGPNQLCLED